MSFLSKMDITEDPVRYFQ
uniref:Uncharacterized protein n=1 Tax=Anguilla anguilla TaxID=7936 RepID=A0A0E9UKD0_ANGAN